MIGEVLVVYEVDDNFAGVEKFWRDTAGQRHSHSIALLQDEMELISVLEFCILSARGK